MSRVTAKNYLSTLKVHGVNATKDMSTGLLQIDGSDPLAWLLVRLRIRQRWMLFSLWAACGTLVTVVIPLLSGVWSRGSVRYSASEEWVTQLTDILLIPFVVSFYVVQSDMCRSLFPELQRRLIHARSERSYNEFIEYWNRVFNPLPCTVSPQGDPTSRPDSGPRRRTGSGACRRPGRRRAGRTEPAHQHHAVAHPHRRARPLETNVLLLPVRQGELELLPTPASAGWRRCSPPVDDDPAHLALGIEPVWRIVRVDRLEGQAAHSRSR